MASTDKRVLIVDDDPVLLRVVTRVLQNDGYETVTATDGAEAIRHLGGDPFHVVLTDLLMEPIDGLGVLEAVRAAHPETPVIIITACQAVDRALAAMRAGAFDYVVKPVRIDVIQNTLHRALHYRDHMLEVQSGEPGGEPATRMRNVVAESPAMRRACAFAERLALANVPILLVGETGTGKARLAAAIHEESHRCTQFVPIACSPEPDGAFEHMLSGRDAALSRGDTVYLSGVDVLTADQQSRLLAFVRRSDQSRGSGVATARLDVRMLMSSPRPLRDLVKKGHFLSELEQRISSVFIHLPPLRERPADIVPLARMFLSREEKGRDRSMAFSGEVEGMLRGLPWPGNADEIEGAVQAAAAACEGPIIERRHLPEPLRSAPASGHNAGASPERNEKLRGEAFTSFIKSRQKQMISGKDQGARSATNGA